jgi:hypothetical protein
MSACTFAWIMWTVGAATIGPARGLEVAAILALGSAPNLGTSTSAHGVNGLGEACCADDRPSRPSTPANARDPARSFMTRSMGRGDHRDRTAESLNPRDSPTIE